MRQIRHKRELNSLSSDVGSVPLGTMAQGVCLDSSCGTAKLLFAVRHLADGGLFGPFPLVPASRMPGCARPALQ